MWEEPKDADDVAQFKVDESVVNIPLFFSFFFLFFFSFLFFLFFSFFVS